MTFGAAKQSFRWFTDYIGELNLAALTVQGVRDDFQRHHFGPAGSTVCPVRIFSRTNVGKIKRQPVRAILTNQHKERTVMSNDTATELPEMIEMDKAAPGPFELWATIKKSSKYYRQGLNDQGKPVAFPIRAIQMNDYDGYDFKGGMGGQYRREDLTLHVRVGTKLKKI